MLTHNRTILRIMVTVAVFFAYLPLLYSQCPPEGISLGDAVIPVWKEKLSLHRPPNNNNGKEYTIVHVIGGIEYLIEGRENIDIEVCSDEGKIDVMEKNSFFLTEKLRFSPHFSGTVRISYKIRGDKATPTITATGGSNTIDNHDSAGKDKWREHFYGGKNFDNYLGYYDTQPESFDEVFGGSKVEKVAVYSQGIHRLSLPLEGFSVRFLMESTRSGLYYVSIGSDDGSRLFISNPNSSNPKAFDDWKDHSYRQYSNQIISLSGESRLELEYYNNIMDRRVSFKIDPLIENKIDGGGEFCPNETEIRLTGDAFRNKENEPRYEWSYYAKNSYFPEFPENNTEQNFIINTKDFPQGEYTFYRQVNVTKKNQGTNDNVPSHLSKGIKIVIGDIQKPDFTLPTEISLCVSPIENAVITAPSTEIVTNDYYLFAHGDTILDLNEITDNCCQPEDMTLKWQIHYADNTKSEIFEGQPSKIDMTKTLKIQGDTAHERVFEHKIEYWLIDCHDNESEHKTTTLKVLPRPNIILQ